MLLCLHNTEQWRVWHSVHAHRNVSFKMVNMGLYVNLTDILEMKEVCIKCEDVIAGYLSALKGDHLVSQSLFTSNA